MEYRMKSITLYGVNAFAFRETELIPKGNYKVF